MLGTLPVILWRPYIGVLMWSWLGYMNPHRMTFGFAYSFPFAQLVGVATLVGLLFSRERKVLPIMPLTVVWLTFVFWMNVTSWFAFNTEYVWLEWDRVMKIQLFAFVSIVLMHNRERINYLVWVIVGSLAFYGVKGGIFSILTGSEHRVWGPKGSFIEGNNELGLALTMTAPLIWYLHLQVKGKWAKLAMLAALGLTVIAILSTHSRGALLAIAAMCVFLVMSSRHKLWLTVALIFGAPMLWFSMPDHWHERMGTIQTYEEDESAMGRINAWKFAYALASDRPIVGGGFFAFTPELFETYAPEPENYHDAHSVYFEILGEHGFPGLFLFLAMGALGLRTAGKVVKANRDSPETVWMSDLAAMLQVSLVAYAVGGLFLGLAYFDLYYNFLVVIVVLSSLTKSRQEAALTADRPKVKADSAPAHA